MIKQLFCFILLFLLPVQYIAAQSIKEIKGVVTDADNQPLPYVSIGIVNSPYGTVSDDAGSFIVQFPDSIQNSGSLRFSYIGYEAKAFLLSAIPGRPLTVKLAIAATELNTITVRPVHTEVITTGITHKNGMMSNNFAISGEAGQNIGAEIGERFTLGGERNYLNALNVYINRNNFDTIGFRVNIYSIKDGLPGKSLLDKNLYLTILNQNKGWVELDLKQYHLMFDEDVIVSLQWISHSRKGTSLSLPIIVPSPGRLHYYKFGSQGIWKKYSNMATSMNLEVEREVKRD